MRVRPTLVLALTLAGAAPLPAAFPGTDVFLPMVGRAPGVPPSQWYTTVWAYNPNPTAVDVRFLLLERNKANTSPIHFDDVLQPGETRKYDNAIQTMFGRSAWGAIRVVAEKKVIVNERFFDQPPGTDVSDTTGQYFAGLPKQLAIGLDESTQILGGYQTLPAGDSDFRYNFGFVETTGSSARIRVTVLDALGGELGSREYAISAYSQLQYAFRDHFPDVDCENARLRAEVISGSGRVIAYGTGIANGSQDPTTFEMAMTLPLAAATVEHDGTLTGDGSAASPLGLADAAVTLEKIAATNAPAAAVGAVAATRAEATQVLATDGATLSWQPLGVSGLAAGGVTFGGAAGDLAQDAANLYWDDATNALGIGTAAPTQQLELTGNLKLPSTTATAGQIFLGSRRFLHGAGTDNVFVGPDAGTTAPASAVRNVGVGAAALQSLTEGDDNTAVGLMALAATTSGAFNAALGGSALVDNTTGSQNTAVGHKALSGNVTGTGSTAVGYGALAAGTALSASTAVGLQALARNTAGHNTACGHEALAVNTTGTTNSAFGEGALSDSTTGYSNVAVGHRALAETETGSDNTALGASALAELVDGRRNVAVGDEAGDGLADGDDNIYVGAAAGAAEESATIRIGTAQTAAYLAGAAGATSAGGVPLLVGADGKLGTASSSRRYKEGIVDVGDESELVLRLRPVAFYYRPERDPERVRQYGLVAEEVAEVAPGLVVRSAAGEPEAVRYQLVNALLLAEVQRQRRELDEQGRAIAELTRRLAELEGPSPPPAR